jgi:peptidyl-tRNA hydrolase
VASYVLSEFSEEEKKILEEEVFPKIYERLIKNELSPDIN